MAGEQAERANQARIANEARRASTTGGSYQGASGLIGGLGRALRGPAAQFAEGLGTGGVSGGLDVASFQRQIESEVTKAVNNMFQTLTSAVSAAATRAIRDMQTQVNSVTAQSQLYTVMTPEAGAAAFAQPQRRTGAGTPAMQAAGTSPAQASGGASQISAYNPMQIAAPAVPGIARQTVLPPGQTVFAGPIGSTGAGPGTVSAAQLGQITPIGPVYGGAPPPVPPGPRGTAYSGPSPYPPGPRGTAFAGTPSRWQNFRGLMGSAGGAIRGGGLGDYARFNLASEVAGAVTGGIGQMQEDVISTSMAQTQLAGRPGAGGSFQSLWNNLNYRAAGRFYGYTPDQTAAAFNMWTRAAPGGNAEDINRFAGFGAGTGVGLQGVSQFMSQMAQAGAVGGARGSMGVTPFLTMMAGGMARSTISTPQDWMQGMSDLLRQQQTMTMNTPDTKTLTGYYSAINRSGNAALAGQQGAQFLNTIGQNIANASNASPAMQTMWYQALGPISPIAMRYVTQRALTPTDIGGRHYDPLRQMHDLIYRQYRDPMSRMAMMAEAFTGGNMPMAEAMMDPRSGLFTAGGQVAATADPIRRLATRYHMDLSTPRGMAQLPLLAQINAAGWNRGALDKAARALTDAGVEGVRPGQSRQEMLRHLARWEGGTEADKQRQAMTSLRRAIEQLTEALRHPIAGLQTSFGGWGGATIGAASYAAALAGTRLAGFGLRQAAPPVARGAARVARRAAPSAARRAVPAAARAAAAGGRGIAGRVAAAALRLGAGFVGAGAAELAVPAAIVGAGVALGVGGSWAWNEHQKDLHKTDVNAFLADMKNRHIQGNWSQVSTRFGIGHPGLRFSGPRGTYTIDIGNLARDPNTGEWYEKSTGNKLAGIGQPAPVTGGGGHGVEAHTRAATQRTTDLVSRILDPSRPLTTRTEQQLRTDLQKFIQGYGDALVAWQRNALGVVGGPAGDTGGTAGNTGGSYGGDTFRSNTLGGYNVTSAQGTNISGAGLKFGSYRDVREVGPVFNVGAGNAVTLPEGGRYDATRSTNYNSIFVTPEGQAISFLHLKARKFANNQFVSAGTNIGQGLSRGGTFTGRTSTGASWTGGMTDPGLVEVDVFNAAQGHSAAEQAFSRPQGGAGTGEVDVMNWLATRQGHGVGGGGAVMDILRDESRKFGIPLNILVAQATRESGMGTNEVQTGGGGRGLFQFDFSNPANIRNASKWLGQAAGLGPNISEAKARQLAMNNRINAMASGAMMKDLYKRYGSWESALTAYNTGHGGTSEYARSIMSSHAVGGGHGVPVEHPSHPHHQKTAAKQAISSPVVNIGNVMVEITLPNGTVERIQGARVKFDGVAGLHVQTGHAKQVAQFKKSPKR